MKKTLVLMALFMSAQAFAFDVSTEKDYGMSPIQEEQEKKKTGLSSSESLYSDVECDMSDYTCYKVIMDLGRQEAIAHVMAGGNGEKSTVLAQAIDVYRNLVPLAQNLTDEEIIYLLATE